MIETALEDSFLSGGEFIVPGSHSRDHIKSFSGKAGEKTICSLKGDCHNIRMDKIKLVNIMICDYRVSHEDSNFLRKLLK